MGPAGSTGEELEADGQRLCRGFGEDSGLLCPPRTSGVEAVGRVAEPGGSPPSCALTVCSGRQVEYLYSLVYQALDFISGTK